MDTPTAKFIVSQQTLDEAFNSYVNDPIIASLIEVFCGDKDLFIKGMRTAFMAGAITAITEMVKELLARVDREKAVDSNQKVN